MTTATFRHAGPAGSPYGPMLRSLVAQLADGARTALGADEDARERAPGCRGRLNA